MVYTAPHRTNPLIMNYAFRFAVFFFFYQHNVSSASRPSITTSYREKASLDDDGDKSPRSALPSAAWRLFLESADGDGRRTPHQTDVLCAPSLHKMLIIFKLNSFSKWNLFAFVRHSVDPAHNLEWMALQFVVLTVFFFFFFLLLFIRSFAFLPRLLFA